MTGQNGVVNGVDVDRLFETIDAVGENPTVGQFTFRTWNRWFFGGRNQSRINGFSVGGQETGRSQTFILDADEPPVLLGDDRGANPVEFLLHALASCLTTSLVYHAAALGIRLTKVRSRLDGNLDLRGFLGISDRVRNGFEKVGVTFQVEGDATDEELQELCLLAQKRSPVFDMLTNGVPVAVKMEKGRNEEFIANERKESLAA